MFFVLLIIVIVCASVPSGWDNSARITPDGRYVETHTTCGPIQGLVEGLDEFSFLGIPYAVPVLGVNRWTYSRPMTNLEECYEGTFIAHSRNVSGAEARCWRKYPSGSSKGNEDCLTLDIHTSNVIYEGLHPVVVYVDGDDLTEQQEFQLRPSAALAKNHSVVFVSVGYRRGMLGFLSLDSLAKRNYPANSGNYGLGDIISALQWVKLNIHHFGGHPGKVTLLGRGSGATLVTVLTATNKARSLFKGAWVSNGAGVFQDKSLQQANKENKVLLSALNCGNDEAECLIDATADDLTDAIPFEWLDTRQRELPQIGETGHSWLVLDKNILLESPKTFWTKNKLSNNVPIVFGATAQGEVTADNYNYIDWANSDTFSAHVENKLGSFNTTIADQALSLYNFTDDVTGNRNHWWEYATMLSDIRTVCPILNLAQRVSQSFVAPVYAYVADQKRSGVLGDIADATSDLAAVFGTYPSEGGIITPDEESYIRNMQDAFYTFVRESQLPHGDIDLSKGMYIVNKNIVTQKDYPNCDFWKRTFNIVPNYGYMD